MKEHPRKISILRDALEKRTFKNYEVQEDNRKLGEGVYSIAKRADVSLTDAPGYNRSFVLKRPKLVFGGKGPETEKQFKMVEDVLTVYVQKYTDMKAKGIKHLPTTFRLGGIAERDPVIAMTDYTEEGRKVVLSNNTVENRHNVVISVGDVTNIQELYEDIYQNIKRITDARYSVTADSYFFIMPADHTDAHMEFAIADFDGCTPATNVSNTSLFVRNLEQAMTGLQYVLNHHMADKKKSIAHIDLLRQFSDQDIEEARLQAASDSGEIPQKGK